MTASSRSTVTGLQCRGCSLRQKRCFRELSAAELAFVEGMNRGQIRLVPGQALIAPGDTGRKLYTLVEGWAARRRHLADGSHQILDLLLPGDLIGMQSALTGRALYSVEPLTPIRCCVFDVSLIPELIRRHPELCMSLMQSCAEEEQRSDLRTALLGAGSATQRLAYFILDILSRLQARGMAEPALCPFPLRRQQLAEIIGLSEVHVSRTFSALRRGGIIHLANNLLTVVDQDRLHEAAGAAPPAPLPNRALL